MGKIHWWALGMRNLDAEVHRWVLVLRVDSLAPIFVHFLCFPCVVEK